MTQLSTSHNSTNHYQAKFNLCVYCGSRAGNLNSFAQVAEDAGQLIAQYQAALVYGGGLRGLMGSLARSAQRHGAPTIGVIPQKLTSIENTNTDCTVLYTVNTMHERKAKMAELADAFLALPGGLGTFDEFFEIWTMRYLNYHQKPIALLNLNNFYTPLLNFLDSCVNNGLMDQSQLASLIIADNLPNIFTKLTNQLNSISLSA